MRYKKSELTKIAKEIARTNSDVLNVIGYCSDLVSNDVIDYIIKNDYVDDEECEEIITELARKFKNILKICNQQTLNYMVLCWMMLH